jgi:putative ABC transport system ATP-binding protein
MNAPAAASAVTTAEALLSLSGISKSYLLGGQRVPALSGVNLDIDRGEFVALTGPSGSGKSTLLNICGLLDRPDDGAYRLDGIDAASLSEEERSLLRREKIGFVFQGFNLIPVMTAFENVEYPLLLAGVGTGPRRERVMATLAAVGLTGFERRRPDELSGGQRQRVAVARALVKGTRLLIADEPTANLDSITAEQIIGLMHGLAEDAGVTVIVATHDARVAARCDIVVTLRDGSRK